MILFSERNGYKLIKEIQIDDIDNELETKIWNLIYKFYIRPFYNGEFFEQTPWYKIIHGFFKLPINEYCGRYLPQLESIISKLYRKLDWDKIYSLLEFVIRNDEDNDRKQLFIQEVNRDLESEKSAYRIFNDTVSSIIDQESIDEIEKAFNQQNPFLDSHPKCFKTIFKKD